MLQKAGSSDVELAAETGFNSSPMTKGVLLRAVKSVNASQRREDVAKEPPLSVAAPGFT
jgi:hypothetical protein